MLKENGFTDTYTQLPFGRTAIRRTSSRLCAGLDEIEKRKAMQHGTQNTKRLVITRGPLQYQEPERALSYTLHW